MNKPTKLVKAGVISKNEMRARNATRQTGLSKEQAHSQ